MSRSRLDLQGNWEAVRIPSSSLCLANVPSMPSTRDMPLEMQTDVSAMVASITSTQEILAPLVNVERALICIKSRLYARSLDKNRSLAMGKARETDKPGLVSKKNSLASLNDSTRPSRLFWFRVASSRNADTKVLHALRIKLAYAIS